MITDAIYSRRSVRKFMNREVPRELLEKLLDAGRVAPSAKNRQPWKYIVFCGESKKALLECMEKGLAREETDCAVLPRSRNGLTDARNTLRIMKEVPIIIVVLNTNGKSIFEGIDTDSRVTEICDTLSIGASIENILLKAEELGFGTLWIANTCYAYPELADFLQTEHQLVGAIAVGYAAEKPNRRPRKNLEEVVEFRM